MPDRDERARVTMLTSFDPITIQILSSRRFFPKRLSWRCQFWPSAITPPRPQRGWDCDQCRRNQRLRPSQPPSPSLDYRFESDRSSVSTASSVSSQSDRSEGSWHSWLGRWHRETGAHTKINLPIFKDEDAKDAITYWSWRWDLIVYHWVGCRDCTLLPYAIGFLQGTPEN